MIPIFLFLSCSHLFSNLSFQPPNHQMMFSNQHGYTSAPFEQIKYITANLINGEVLEGMGRYCFSFIVFPHLEDRLILPEETHSVILNGIMYSPKNKSWESHKGEEVKGKKAYPITLYLKTGEIINGTGEIKIGKRGRKSIA